MKTKITHFPRLITILTGWLATFLIASNVYADDTIVYRSGRYSDSPSQESVFIVPSGKSHTVQGQLFLRQHAIFKGWATSENAVTPTYTTGSTITISSNRTLYPVWDFDLSEVNSNVDYLKVITTKEKNNISICEVDTMTKLPIVMYSVNGEKWRRYSYGTKIVLKNIGDSILFCGQNTHFNQSGAYLRFVFSDSAKVSGNIMTLLDTTGTSLVIPSSYCFHGLFKNCSVIITAPELPATTLTSSCYSEMFSGCSSLRMAPKLPANKWPTASLLSYGSYANMFKDCSKLKMISVNFHEWQTDDNIFSRLRKQTSTWVSGVSPTGVFICPSDLELLVGNDYLPAGWVTGQHLITYKAGMMADSPDSIYFGAKQINQPYIIETNKFSREDFEFQGWTTIENSSAIQYNPGDTVNNDGDLILYPVWTYVGSPVDSTVDYLCVKTLNPNNKVSIEQNGIFYFAPNLRYSINGENWHYYDIGDTIILANLGDSVLFSGTNKKFSYSEKSYLQFQISDSAEVNGNIMTLLSKSGTINSIPNEYCFYRAFKGCKILSAPNLPATTLSTACYSEMFYGCTLLRNAPILPANTLAERCYRSMFQGCESLIEAPQLPATKLSIGCYQSMFQECRSLARAPLLPSTSLANDCYNSMFQECESLTTPPTLPATSLSSRCYQAMFKGCKSLMIAPELPKLQRGLLFIRSDCYKEMFANCINLRLIRVKSNDVFFNSWPNTTTNWVVNVAERGAFIRPSNLKYKSGDNYIPSNWAYGEYLITYNSGEEADYPDSIIYDAFDYHKISSSLFPFLNRTKKNNVYIKYELFTRHGYVFLGWATTDNASQVEFYPGDLANDLNMDISLFPVWLDTISSEVVDYLSVKAKRPNVHLQLGSNGDFNMHDSVSLEYSTNGNTWNTYVLGSTINLDQIGDYVLFRGNNLSFSQSSTEYYQFHFSDTVEVRGNVMTLLDKTGKSTTIPNNYCFYRLFANCSTMVSSPRLPAMSLANSCYEEMFYECKSLLYAPTLPATNLNESCYESMFKKCTNLDVVPELPSTQLAKCCYRNMFDSCINVIYPSDLPATVLAEYCYSSMFNNCSSLNVNISGPGKKWKIPAATAAIGSITDMFLGTSGTMNGTPSINTTYYIKSEYDNCTVAVDVNDPMMGEVSGEGICEYGDTMLLNASAYPNYHFVCWNDDNVDNPRQVVVTQDTLFTAIFDADEQTVDYLCVKTKRPNNTVKLNEVFETNTTSGGQGASTSPYLYDLEYSFDGNTWTTYTIGGTISLSNIGDSVMFRGNNMSISRSDTAYCQFQFSDTVEVSGNIMTLVDKTGKSTTIPNDYCFAYLFKNCSTMVSAPRLPATILKDYCYEGLFQACSGLTTAPILPATTMAIRCYRYMFMDCSSLETAPSLPARNLAMECYSNMFRCCSTLTTAPTLPATNLAYSSYNGMFYNCTSLTKAPALPATTLSERSYCWMFYGCSSLKEAPLLPATKMTEDCYYRMFQGCSALVVIPPLPATILAEYCYYSMFQGCASLTTLPSLPAINLANACYYHMFDGCVSLIVNESGAGKQWKIPATTIAGLTNPLKGMFTGTSGTMNGTPSVNTTYYVASDTTCIPLCFTARNGNITVRFEIKNVTHTIQYSTNGTSWSNYTSNSDVAINANQSIYFRAASNQTTAKAFGSGYQMQYTGSRFYFTSSNDGTVEASGNIMSLYGPDCPNLSLSSKAFAGMFSNCDLLTTAPLLPATYLGADCYNSMFYMCTSLVKAPDLPAMTMASTCYENMFRGCTSLQKAPELPALNLAYGCYDNMFYDCTSLTIAPELPATTLQGVCYGSMFFNCYSLKEPPVLPATDLPGLCYAYMFKNCTSMVINKVGPGKPWKITTSSGSGNSGLSQMFTGTSGTMNGTPSVNTTYYIASSSDYYTVTVNINDSTMGNVTGSGSYSYGDTAILTATANPHCRFVNWSNGMTTPTIRIRVLGDSILTANFAANPIYIFPETHTMCQGETYSWRGKLLTTEGVYYDSLKTVLEEDSVYELTLTVNPKYLIEDTIYALSFPYQWHGRDIVSSGIYYDSLTTEGSGCDSIYKLTVIDSPKPLCFTAKGGSVTVRFDIKNVTHTIQYSTDGASWSNYTSNTNVTLSANQSICFRAASNQTIATAFSTYGDSSNSRFYFSSTDGGMVEASGNIMSLYGPDCPNLQLQRYAFQRMFSECSLLTIAPSLPATNLASACYANMFSNCISLTTAPSLPATNLANWCYASMFSNCISLTTAPSLPATNLANYCYTDMFYGCTSLTTAPSLPATNLADYCYWTMFWGCNSLTTAPSLPATNLADDCYNYMFYGCTSLTTAPSLPATNLANSCYSSMFYGCTSLTTAPSLPATNLADRCYYSMFSGCRSLTTAPSLPATNLADHCYQFMFNGCNSLTTAPSLPATNLANSCYSGMFSNCFSLTTAPSLPATNLADHCYYGMFGGCTSLTSAPELPANSLALNCYGGMFFGCFSLTTAPSLPATNLADHCYYRMFGSCRSLTTAPSLPATNLANHCYEEMFSGCTSLTTVPLLQATTLADSCYLKMFSGCTSLIVNTTGPGKQWKIPAATIDGLDNPVTDMFTGTSGTMNGTPLVNTTYYLTSGKYSVTVNVNDSTMGSALGNGLYEHGDTAILVAFANPNYHFVRWSNGMISPTIYLEIFGDTSLTAIFEANQTYFIPETHTICQGETYNWHNKSLTASGIYYDSLKSQYGSDSVYQLTLTVNPTYLIQETYSICQGETYSWRARNLSTAGVYYDSLKTTVGCDSIYKLTLKVNSTYLIQQTVKWLSSKGSYYWRGKAIKASGIYYDSLKTISYCDSVYKLTIQFADDYLFTENASICQGAQYSWRGHLYGVSGIYYDSLRTVDGILDSVYKLTLIVNPTYLFQETYSTCQGETYNWRNRNLTTAGVYYDSLQTVAGCDSVYELTLTVNPTYFFPETFSICQGETYNWRNRNLTAAGVYYDSLQTVAGCDSVYKLTLTVNPTYIFTETYSICQGESYSWRNRNLTAAGVYYDSLQTTVGCDSVYELTLTVNPTYLFQETYSICHGETYNWRNRNLTTAGVYYDSLQTVAGCDSVYELTLTVNPTYFFQETHSICQGETYSWRTRDITTAGVYYDSLQTVAGCDSVYELTLTVKPTYLFQETYSICQGETYNWKNKSLTTAGVYYDSLQTVAGCDSVYELTLTVNPTYIFPETYSICQGETYNWRNRNLNAAGVYYDSLQTVEGCDSVYKLTLTVNPTYIFTETYSICQGESYSWRNRNLTAAGVYYDSLKTVAGCDSVYELTLTVNPTYLIQETYSICRGETYSWRNKSLANAGIYYDSLQTAAGCDSVYELTLTVNPTYFFPETYSICQGETYSWRSKNLTTSGVYYDSLKTVAGCDSVYELTLTVNPTYFFPETYSICQGETYSWRSKNLTTAGVYYDSLQTVAGCDSVYELTLTVNPTYFFQEMYSICQGETYSWRSKSLTNAGVYYDSLLTAVGCDSVYELTLTVNPTYLIQQTYSICQGETYNWRNRDITTAGIYYDSLQTSVGCDSVYELTLTVNPTYFIQESDVICHGDVYNWHSMRITDAGIYYDSLKTMAGCDSVYELTLTINNYNVSVNVNDVNGGKSYLYIDNAEALSAVVECGETVELHAEAFANYHFVEWSDSNTDSIRNVEVVGDTSLVAMFEPNCGEWANWPVAFKYNSLLILNVDSIYSMGYYPNPEDVAWYKVVGEPDDLNDMFPADDQYICNGYYMSLITNNLSYGQYYAMVDVSRDAGVLCHDKMRTEIVEYAYNGQKIHIELAPTNVKDGDVMTVSGLVPDEETTLRIYDYSGKLIETVKSNGLDKCQITAVGSAGVYMVSVISNSVSETLKFIVTK